MRDEIKFVWYFRKSKRSFDSFLALVFAWLIPNVGLRWLISLISQEWILFPFTFGWGTHFLRWSSLTDTHSLRWRSRDSFLTLVLADWFHWSVKSEYYSRSPFGLARFLRWPSQSTQGGIPTRDLWPHVNLVNHSATRALIHIGRVRNI